MMYIQDYDEVFFHRFFPATTPTTASHVHWIDTGAGRSSLLEPYVKNTQIAKCPSDSTLAHGYGYNGELTYTVSLGKISKPAEIMMFVDDTWGGRIAYLPANVTTGASNLANWGANFAKPATAPFTWGVNTPYGRHNDGVNVAFCDGHAKWLKPEVLWADCTNKYYRDW